MTGSRAAGTSPRATGANPRARGTNKRQTSPFATLDFSPDELRELSYADYRMTKHWRNLRRKVLKRAEKRCERCGLGGRLDVHHLTYDRLGEEPLDDLLALCRECHRSEHRLIANESGAWLRDTSGAIIGRVVEVVVDVRRGGTFKEGALSVVEKTPEETKTKEGGAGEENDECSDVWNHYVEVHNPRRKILDAEARTLIRSALKVATAAECCGAIDGNKASDFHQGQNDKGKRYNGISHILKGKRGVRTTREQIDLFLAIAEKAGVSSPAPDAARVSQAKRAVLDALEFPGDAQVVERGRRAEEWLNENGWRAAITADHVEFFREGV